MNALSRAVVVRERETIPVAGGELPVTWFHASDAPGPGLVVVPSIYGVHPDLERQMAHMARESGAMVVAIDSFWRLDHGPVPYCDRKRAIVRMQQLDREAALADFEAAAAWTRSHARCSGKVAGLGVCFGGPFVLLGASRGVLDAGATWHGTALDRVLHLADRIDIPLTLHFGAEDPVVPLSTVDQVRTAFGGRSDVEVVVHHAADHGYSHSDGPRHHEGATVGSLEATIGLVRNLAG